MAGAEAAAGDQVRLETVYCLGLCSVGPSARVINGDAGDTVLARLDAGKLARLITALSGAL